MERRGHIHFSSSFFASESCAQVGFHEPSSSGLGSSTSGLVTSDLVNNPEKLVASFPFWNEFHGLGNQATDFGKRDNERCEVSEQT